MASDAPLLGVGMWPNTSLATRVSFEDCDDITDVDVVVCAVSFALQAVRASNTHNAPSVRTMLRDLLRC